MQYFDKLCNFSSLLSCIPIPKLGNNDLSIVKRKQFMVSSMLTILGVIPLPLLHISSNNLFCFLPTCMLIKRIPLSNKILSFLSTSLQILHLIICRLPFNPKHNSAHGSFITQDSLNFLLESLFFFFLLMGHLANEH
jgi:hypothetical protein